MEEFENFFSQLIPAPDQDIWLLSTSQQIQQQQQNDGVSASGIPVGWSFQNLIPNGTTLNGGIGISANTNINNGSGNNNGGNGNNNGVMITGLDNNPQIREQLAILQQQQQNQQSQIQQQLQTYQQLQQQQYQQRQQQYQQQYQQPYTTPSPPQDLSPQQQPVTINFNNGNGNNNNGNDTASSIQQQIQLQLQVQQFQQQHQQQQQLQAQQEQYQHQALQQAQQQHFQQQAQQQAAQAQQQHAQNKQDQQIKQQLHAQQQYQQQIQQQVQNAQQIHNQQQAQQAQQQQSQPQPIQTSGSIPLQQQAMLQAQSLMNSILNHDSTPSSSPNTTSNQFLNTPILDHHILSSIKPTYSQIAKSQIQQQQDNTQQQHVGFNSSTPHLDDLTGAVDNSNNNGNGKKATKNGKQPKQPKQPAIPKQPKQTNKQKKQTDQIPQQNVETFPTSTSISTSFNQQSDNMGGFDFFEDDDKKKSVNRINQNLASRNYRQRRKEYIKEIESKMASLTFENHQLKKENETLKETGGVEVMRPEPELITMVMEGKQIINQLSQALKKNDERTLIYLLHLYHCAIAKRYSIVEREVEKIVHPYTQSKLAAMGYIPKSDKMFLNCIAGPAADSWFQLFKNEAEITPDQSLKLEALRVQHGKIDAALIQERQELDLDIKKFYYTKILVLPNNPLVIGDIPAQPYNVNDNSQSPQNNNSPLEISQLLDFAGKLESLKKNFILHRNLMLDTLASLSSILAPKQEAMLLVRVHAYTSYDFTHMELLKDVWTNIVSSKAVNGPLNIAEALKKMSDTTNTHQTIENIVKPPQFHQYTPKPPTQQLKFENQSNNFGNNNQQSSSINNSNSDISLNNSNNINNTTLPAPSADAIPYPNPGSNQAKRFQWFNYPSGAPN